MAHNLDRWTARIGLGEQLATNKTLRRRFFSIAGRLTRSARRPPCICPSAGPGKTSSNVPWHDCERFHSQPDGGAGNRPAIRPTGRPRQLAPTRSARGTSRLPPVECRPPWPSWAAIIVSVWLPHAALIPTYWNRAWPVRLPLPINPGVNASAHPYGGFGFTLLRKLPECKLALPSARFPVRSPGAARPKWPARFLGELQGPL